MKNSEATKKFMEIYKRQEMNLRVFSQCASYLNYTPCAMDKENMEQITGGVKALEEKSFAIFLSSIFCKNENEANLFLEEYYVKGVKKLNQDEYKNDPYYKNIKIPSKQIGKWTLGVQKYKPYEAFIYRDIIREDFVEIPQIGFFDKEFSFPTVYENGTEWMAIKPNEIETMKKPAQNACGSVLVFGLGLGYFPYIISLKEQVTSITIVERDESVIELFESYILPQFENKQKIRVIKSDAFEYAENKMSNEDYDYVFTDLWHDVSDGVSLYVKMKKQEHLLPNAKFDYWIEKSLLSVVRVNLLDGIYEKISKEENVNLSLVSSITEDESLAGLIKFL